MADTRLFPYDIECHIQEKTIELKGVVSREEEKTLASLLTANLLTEKDIINNIEVQPALSAKIQGTSDSRLTDLVKQRFANSQTLRETNFEVVTLLGVVSLKGHTRFQVIVLEAAQAAREVPGVIAVDTQNVRLGAEHE
jgi:hyperosmotically inducible protein